MHFAYNDKMIQYICITNIGRFQINQSFIGYIVILGNIFSYLLYRITLIYDIIISVIFDIYYYAVMPSELLV